MAEWGDVLDVSFYERDAHELAVALLGQVLVGEIGGELVAGRLIELEVYGGADDPACHADRGAPTERTRSMFGSPGIAYVYRIYGMYDCLNVVAPRGETGKAAAILIRAVEPMDGVDVMQRRRDTTGRTNVTSGPGKLCQAFGIDRGLDGHALQAPPLSICAGDPVASSQVQRTPRIGLNEKTCGASTHFSWRYVERLNAHLSR